jgi:glycerophosphoryl diester phosphodiesterase
VVRLDPGCLRKYLILVPTNMAPLLWGWPHRFQERMARVKTQIFAVGPYWGDEYSTGIDEEADLRRLPWDYKGGISTDRIYTISRIVAKGR